MPNFKRVKIYNFQILDAPQPEIQGGSGRRGVGDPHSLRSQGFLSRSTVHLSLTVLNFARARTLLPSFHSLPTFSLPLSRLPEINRTHFSTPDPKDITPSPRTDEGTPPNPPAPLLPIQYVCCKLAGDPLGHLRLPSKVQWTNSR